MTTKGNNVILFINDQGQWKAWAYGLACDIDISCETINVSHPSYGRWRTKKKKRMGWTMRSSHLLGDEYTMNAIRKGIIGDSTIKVMIGSVADHKQSISAAQYKPDGGLYFAGDAYVTRCTITANRGTTCTISVELEGSGQPDWRK